MNRQYYRIIDANINRACEGLRVIEDYLRFIANDKQFSERIKQYRHTLRQISINLSLEKLLNARKANTDVGKDIPSPSDTKKTNSDAIIAANFKRIQEALRTIEEYAKPINSKTSEQAANMRFEIYQLEHDITKFSAKHKFENVKLYLLIGSDVCEINKIDSLVPALLDAGVDCLQLREKKLSDKIFFKLAEKLTQIVHRQDKIFIINDRPDIALACGADGVHIGQDDLPKQTVEQIIGPSKIIGISTHNISQLKQAIDLRPTYIAIGPAYETQTKPTEPVAGLNFIKQALSELRQANIPEIVIGGINLNNIDELMHIGVKRIALCNAILSADNPIFVTQKFAQILKDS